jgi:hypothetical protein
LDGSAPDLFIVQAGNQYGFINASGTVGIQTRFRYAKPFSEGMAAVKVRSEKGYGFINTRGEMVIDPAFDHVSGFHEGFSGVMSDNR